MNEEYKDEEKHYINEEERKAFLFYFPIYQPTPKRGIEFAYRRWGKEILP